MKKTRLVALLLALVMVAGLFAACNGTEPETTTTAATTTEATTTEATTTEATTTEATTTEATTEDTEATTEATTEAPAGLDLGGREWTYVDGSANTFHMYPYDDLESEYATTWREKWAELEDTYNFTLTKLEGGGDDVAGKITLITAGDWDSLGDTLITKPLEWVVLAVNGYIAALNSDECKANGLDVADSKAFFQPFTQAMQLKGNVYAAQWAGTYNSAAFGWCIYFNPEYISQYGGIDDLFQVVRDMKWDWETFLDLQQKCTVDTDGDGTFDIWGSGEHSYGQEIFTIPGGSIVFYDETDGKYKSGFAQTATQEALQFAQDYYNSGYCETEHGYGSIHRLFNEGKVAMQWGENWNTSADDMGFVNSQITFGIVPIPKHSSADTYANVLGGVPGLTLPKGNSHFAENCAVLQVLGEAFTSDDWADSYAAEEIQGNENSLDMVLNYIWGDHATVYLDLGWAEWETMENYFRNNIYFPIVTGKSGVAEICEQYNAEFQANIDAIFHQ